MQKLAASLLFICLFSSLNAQRITDLGECFEVKLGETGPGNSYDLIQHVYNGAAFSYPENFDLDKGGAITRVSAEIIEEIWRIDIPKSWKYNKVTLEPKKALVYNDNILIVLAIHEDGKNEEASIYAFTSFVLFIYRFA
jgi:hypothetical protein